MQKLYTYLSDYTRSKIKKEADLLEIAMSALASRIIENYYKDKIKPEVREKNEPSTYLKTSCTALYPHIK